MKARAVHLTSVHYPFDTRIFHRECKSLALAGYDVTLIAPHADGDMEMNGVKLRAVSPPKNRRERMTRTIWSVYRAAVQEDADIYHFHDPELLPVGVLLKAHGKKVIYDVHEDYKGTMDGKQWLPTALHKPAAVGVSASENILSCVCDRIIAATPTIAANFPARRTRLVQNFPWLHELVSPDATPYEEREAIGAYVGWLGDHSGIDSMRRAFEIVAEKMPAKLLIGGKVQPGALANFQKSGHHHVMEYLGFLSRPQVAALIASARIGLVTVLPSGNSINAQPTKLFEYMSGGLPVIASDFPVYRKFVEDAQCGLLADPHDPSAIAEAVLWLLRHPSEAAEMGRNGRKAVVERFNWELEAKTLVSTYDELMAT